MLSIVSAIVLILAPFTPHQQASQPTRPIGPPPGVVAEIVIGQIQAYVTAQDLQAYLSYQTAVDTQIAAEAAQRAQEAAQEAARLPQQPPVAAPQASGTVTGPCGGATNGADQYIQRESGGNPNALNPSSGAFGCWQLMPMHFAPGGTCADLSQDLEGQRQCASRLPLSAWAL